MNRKSPNRLRVLRAERRWPQMEVAERLGIGVNRYWKIENGHTVPEESERRKLTRIFGVSESEIFPPEAMA